MLVDFIDIKSCSFSKMVQLLILNLGDCIWCAYQFDNEDY